MPTALVPVLALTSLAILGLLMASPTIATSGPMIVLILAVEHRRWRARSRAEAAVGDLATTVDRLIGQLRAGHSLTQACRTLDQPGPGRAGPALAPLVDSLADHRPLRHGAAALVDGPYRPVRLLGVTLLVLDDNGGPAVPALQRLRLLLVGSTHGRRRAAAAAAQARASAALLVAAPAVFAVVVGLADSSAARFYLYRPLGAACVGAAIALSGLGWWWIARLVDGAIGGHR
jgi:Flp pilus assembly protein TadB